MHAATSSLGATNDQPAISLDDKQAFFSTVIPLLSCTSLSFHAPLQQSTQDIRRCNHLVKVLQRTSIHPCSSLVPSWCTCKCSPHHPGSLSEKEDHTRGSRGLCSPPRRGSRPGTDSCHSEALVSVHDHDSCKADRSCGRCFGLCRRHYHRPDGAFSPGGKKMIRDCFSCNSMKITTTTTVNTNSQDFSENAQTRRFASSLSL